MDVNVAHACKSRMDHVRNTRNVVILAPKSAFIEHIKSCIERNRPWLIVERVEDPGQLCGLFPFSVALILSDVTYLEALEAKSVTLRRIHPLAKIAVFTEGNVLHAQDLVGIFTSSLIRGIIPLDARMDAMFSIMELIIQGGEYFPRRYVEEFRHLSDRREEAKASAEKMCEPEVEGLAELTPRENQILSLVARGLQNKLVAAELTLSENTVKIHVHNIISKLRVHNRTAAAARWQKRHMHADHPSRMS